MGVEWFVWLDGAFYGTMFLYNDLVSERNSRSSDLALVLALALLFTNVLNVYISG